MRTVLHAGEWDKLVTVGVKLVGEHGHLQRSDAWVLTRISQTKLPREFSVSPLPHGFPAVHLQCFPQPEPLFRQSPPELWWLLRPLFIPAQKPGNQIWIGQNVMHPADRPIRGSILFYMWWWCFFLIIMTFQTRQFWEPFIFAIHSYGLFPLIIGFSTLSKNSKTVDENRETGMVTVLGEIFKW